MHPFSPPRFSHKYERRLLIFIMGTTMGNEKENKQDRRRRFSRESLTFKINSCGGKKNTGARRRRIHYPLAFDTRRVAHQVSSLANTAFQQHSFHFTTHVHPTCLSLEPDTCSSFPPSTRLANGMGEISPSSLRSRSNPRRRIKEIDASGVLALVCCYSTPGCSQGRG